MKTPHAAAFAICALGIAIAQAESVEFKPRFDEPLYIEVTQTAEQKMTGAMAPPEGMLIKSVNTNGFWQEARSPRELELKIERIHMHLIHPAPMVGEIEYDSDAPPPADADATMNTFATMFKPWLGRALRAKLNAQNRVEELKGFDEILDAMEEAAAGDMLYEQFKTNLTADGYKALLHDTRFTPLPSGKVEVGDTWKSVYEFDTPNLGKLVSEYDCKLESVKGSAAVISYAGVTRPAAGATPPSNPMGMTPELKSWTFKGGLEYDLKRECVVSMTGDADQQLDLTMGQGDAAQTLHVDAKSTIVTKALTRAERESQKSKASRPSAG
jgi:hypothetical protein